MAAGPWENYAAAPDPDAATGPWAKYKTAQSADAAPSAAAPSAAPTAAPAEAPSEDTPLLGRVIHHIMDYAVNKNPAIGALELGGQAATGALSRIPAGLAGLAHEGTNAAGLTSGDPADTVNAVEHGLTYQPRTH